MIRKLVTPTNSLRKLSLSTIGQRSFAAHASNDKVERTALYDFHVKNGGKIVNFGGYSLPVQYADLGIAASHVHTRKFASIFDVSHMLQTYVRGKDAVECMESICTADIRGAAGGTGSLTVFTNEKGCILDDLIVTKVKNDLLYVVSNAAMKQQDMQIMESAVNHFKSNGKDVAIEFLVPADQSLIAVQGPTAVEALSAVTVGDLSKLYFMNTVVTEVAGVPNCRITRCGYTGEDGVEISIPSDRVEHVTEALLQQTKQQVKLAGLGARDSLRLEGGLCLYGSDIDANTTPIEAALAWLVAKRRRAEENFPGAAVLNKQLKSGVERRRVGIKLTGTGKPPPARAGVEIFKDDQKVGVITSGCPSPSLGFNIAMGYIQEQYKQAGCGVQLKIRDRFYDAEVAKMPFIKTNYYLKPKQ
ncbi:aminomethyltransferase, mitochondrial [Lucilia cuprina]|uniref:aminomethyltransferase, mitochondrial n=1 Tax=Lucilia cuprina TaxID=7375 RepID=UPI001F0506BA|nr:aminomethyltransferase, mitochondrial [Lucilia cuprina]